MTGRNQARIHTDERGQALVEFALVASFLVILVVSILEMSLFLYTYATLTDAAKEGVRSAIVHGSSGTGTVDAEDCGTDLTTAANAVIMTYTNLSFHKLSSSNITITCPNGNAPGNLVTVAVSYPFQPLLLSNWASITISATSAGRIQF